VKFYFTGTEFLYDYIANLSKAVGAKRLPLTILCKVYLLTVSINSIITFPLYAKITWMKPQL